MKLLLSKFQLITFNRLFLNHTRRVDRTFESIKRRLWATTSYYDGPGKTPPKDFEKERKKIMCVLVYLSYTYLTIYISSQR